MNNSNILVSVITCVYNTREEYLIEAVQSILNQTHQKFEYFIVDDCSDIDLYTDKTFKDPRITIIRNKENRGPSYSRNRALELCKGKYIAIMDSDDISLPTRFEKQIEYMENNSDVVACGTWYKHIGDKTNEVKIDISDSDYYKCCLFFGNNPTIINPSVMMRKETLDNNNIKYDESLRMGEDYKMWIQLSNLGVITNYSEILFQYRIHNTQSTNSNKRKRITASLETENPQDEAIKSLGAVLETKEREMLIKNELKKYDPFAYLNMLKKIIKANNDSRYYNIELFKKRVREQWEKYVLVTNNIFKLLGIFLFCKGYRKQSFNIKITQLKRKINRQ